MDIKFGQQDEFAVRTGKKKRTHENPDNTNLGRILGSTRHLSTKAKQH